MANKRFGLRRTYATVSLETEYPILVKAIGRQAIAQLSGAEIDALNALFVDDKTSAKLDDSFFLENTYNQFYKVFNTPESLKKLPNIFWFGLAKYAWPDLFAFLLLNNKFNLREFVKKLKNSKNQTVLDVVLERDNDNKGDYLTAVYDITAMLWQSETLGEHCLRWPESRNNNRLILIVAKFGHVELFKSLINQESSIVDSKNSHGQNLVHIAAAANSAEILKCFFALTGMVENERWQLTGAYSNSGNTPLHYAASRGCLESFKLICEYDNEKRTLLNNEETHCYNLPIHEAAYNGHLSIIKYVLSIAPKMIGKRNFPKLDILQIAAFSGHFELMKYLIEEVNMPVDSIAGDGCTLLHYAASRNREDIADYLIKKSSRIMFARSNAGSNALEYLARIDANNERTQLAHFIFEKMYEAKGDDGDYSRWAVEMLNKINQVNTVLYSELKKQYIETLTNSLGFYACSKDANHKNIIKELKQSYQALADDKEQALLELANIFSKNNNYVLAYEVYQAILDDEQASQASKEQARFNIASFIFMGYLQTVFVLPDLEQATPANQRIFNAVAAMEFISSIPHCQFKDTRIKELASDLQKQIDNVLSGHTMAGVDTQGKRHPYKPAACRMFSNHYSQRQQATGIRCFPSFILRQMEQMAYYQEQPPPKSTM